MSVRSQSSSMFAGGGGVVVALAGTVGEKRKAFDSGEAEAETLRAKITDEGIDPQGGLVISRSGSVEKLLRVVHTQKVVLIRSPPQTGKTSLCQLLHRHLQSQSIVSFRHPVRDWKVDEQQLVIDFIDQKSSEERYLLIDEAQKTYPDPKSGIDVDKDPLWSRIKILMQRTVEQTGQATTYIILFSAYYGHSIGQKTPVRFSESNSLGFEMLRYKQDEFDELVSEFNVLTEEHLHVTAIKEEYTSDLFEWTGGHPGVVKRVFRHIAKFSLRRPWKPDSLFEELQSEAFANALMNERAFEAATHVVGEDSELLHCVTDALVDIDLLKFHDPAVVLRAVEFSILAPFKDDTDTFSVGFPGNLARSVWFQFIFNNHRKASARTVTTLPELICLALQDISAVQIRESLSRSIKDVRYERMWQMHFFAAVCRLFERNFISPDVGPYFGAKGFLDFYINHDRKWGVELLRDGQNVQEHIDRFGQAGRYKKITFNAIALIDFCKESDLSKRVEDAKSSHLFDRGLWLVFYSPDFATFKLFSQSCPTGMTYNFKPDP